MHVLILDHIQPSLFPSVCIASGEEILPPLVVQKSSTTVFDKEMPPSQSMDHY
jgi:hypothetical protein